ncbi:MAG: hypothetical protein U0531_05880 [Dehalococcoidia bacterium]
MLFLSVALIDAVVAELRAGGYGDDTPVVVVHRVTWEDEQICAARWPTSPGG